MAIAESEAQLKEIINAMPDIFFHKNLNGVYQNCNENFVELVGKPATEIIGKTDYDLFDKEVADFFRQHDNEMLKQKQPRRNEEWVTFPDGHKELIDTKKSPFFNQKGELVGLFGLGRDITESKEAQQKIIEQNQLLTEREEELKNSLETKEVLLKEIHHRVKNNLETVSSLLYQQKMLSKNAKVEEALNDSMNRVSSMALIHQFIYKSDNLVNINMNEYISELVGKLAATYQDKKRGVMLNTEIDDIYFDIDKTIPVALVVNEILSNIFKYAFKDKETGSVTINFKKHEKEKVRLIIADTGIGFPVDFKPEKSKTLGMSLIKNLTKRQLKGDLKIASTPKEGVKYEIIF